MGIRKTVALVLFRAGLLTTAIVIIPANCAFRAMTDTIPD
jgi:hypothetical protein